MRNWGSWGTPLGLGAIALLLASGCERRRWTLREPPWYRPPVVTTTQEAPRSAAYQSEADGPQATEQQLALAENARQALLANVRELQAALQKRDQALLQAVQEVQASQDEVARARAELQQWRQETAALQERLRGAEAENAATLRSLVTALEQMVQGAVPAEKPEPAPAEPPKP